MHRLKYVNQYGSTKVYIYNGSKTVWYDTETNRVYVNHQYVGNAITNRELFKRVMGE